MRFFLQINRIIPIAKIISEISQRTDTTQNIIYNLFVIFYNLLKGKYRKMDTGFQFQKFPERQPT